MDSVDTLDDIGRNLTHQTNDEICIGENAKVTQHNPDTKHSDVGDDKENIESPYCLILDVNVAKNNACILQRKNVFEGHKRSWLCTSFSPFDSNCPKQRRIFNLCDQVDLKNIEHGQELYTYPCGIDINKMLLIGQLVWIVNPGKE